MSDLNEHNFFCREAGLFLFFLKGEGGGGASTPQTP